MGLFNIFKNKNIPQEPSFNIDLNKCEYDNWLSFLEYGGTSEEWERLKKQNNLVFPKSETELFWKCQEELQPIANKYYNQLHKEIKSGWSQLYKSKDYTNEFAKKYEQLCIENINLYLQMIAIEKKYNDYTSKSVPAYERLTMLYEKQKNFTKAIDICNDAIKNDASKETMKARRDNLIKKIDKNIVGLTNRETVVKKKTSSNPSRRQQIDPSLIDEAQKVEASKKYCKMIWNKYYSAYPEKPFISKDRELYSTWLDQVELFPLQALIPPQVMTRYKNGLLPGHVYMMHWIKNINRKKVPAYFEYQYGICFKKEYYYLEKQGYIKNNKLTLNGDEILEKYKIVIKNHSFLDAKDKWNADYKVK
ncbi:MAG: hypothetical protein ACLR9T_12975 [Thomasclavelia sp.]|uniref:hypothetical protein n=1 Tax=Thomasclavelia sp. TaxID=3025757 RepID=UPI0039A09F56